MKKNKMVIYRIFRSVLGPIYRFWYHPVISGKENIPNEGPIVVVGNHIHIMDQCNVIISTKRKIHYMILNIKKDIMGGSFVVRDVFLLIVQFMMKMQNLLH